MTSRALAAKTNGSAEQTIHFISGLPPDLFRRFENLSFWREPHLNPRNVKIV
jgi:hypothetical protein